MKYKLYRSKEIIKAIQWFKLGDHPAVHNIPEKYKEFIPIKKGAKGLINISNDKIEFVTSGDFIRRRGNDIY